MSVPERICGIESDFVLYFRIHLYAGNLSALYFVTGGIGTAPTVIHQFLHIHEVQFHVLVIGNRGSVFINHRNIRNLYFLALRNRILRIVFFHHQFCHRCIGNLLTGKIVLHQLCGIFVDRHSNVAVFVVGQVIVPGHVIVHADADLIRNSGNQLEIVDFSVLHFVIGTVIIFVASICTDQVSVFQRFSVHVNHLNGFDGYNLLFCCSLRTYRFLCCILLFCSFGILLL